VTELVVHPLAQQELEEAANFYEARAAGLGHNFIREVEYMLTQIVANSEAGNIFTGAIRRRLLRRYPFAILYHMEAGKLSVIALMHLRRRPGYWKRRLSDNPPTAP
jgi:plasmid stabilization system protein ParE